MIDRVVPTENVRAALAAVEGGNIDAGIVYKTDAGISKQVRRERVADLGALGWLNLEGAGGWYSQLRQLTPDSCD